MSGLLQCTSPWRWNLGGPAALNWVGFRFFFFPLIYPPTLVQWGARAKCLRCHPTNPDKLFCMGNFKNRLTVTKPISRFAHAAAAWPRPKQA
jgi:hypothetical protein